MELREWVIEEHAAVQARVDRQVLTRVPAERWHERTAGGSCITWVLWHAARHQDLAINAVVRGVPEVLAEWKERVGAADLAPGSGLSESEDPGAADALAGLAVAGYAGAVHAATSAWLGSLDLRVLDTRPDSPAALEAAAVPSGSHEWLYRMWEGKDVSWFVSWEAIGHAYSHLGELVVIRNQLASGPI